MVIDVNIIPTVIDKQYGTEKYYDIFSMLLKERIIMISGEINSEMSSIVIAELLYLYNLDNKKDIQIYINSPGGEVNAGLAIFDTMKYLKCDIHTICVGMCASMAAILLAAGTKGKRSSLPNGQIMIHQPMGGVSGQVSDVDIVAKKLVQMKKKLNHILADLTSNSVNKIEKDTDRDNYMDAQEALKYGIIDYVVS